MALLGAAGGIGQPLGLLLKMQPLIDELALYDIANVAGVAADLSHCNTKTQAGTPYRSLDMYTNRGQTDGWALPSTVHCASKWVSACTSAAL